MKAIVSVIGKDKAGIIAKVSAALAEKYVNIEDISQTIVQGNFTMIMMCDLGDKISVAELAAAKPAAEASVTSARVICASNRSPFKISATLTPSPGRLVKGRRILPCSGRNFVAWDFLMSTGRKS